MRLTPLPDSGAVAARAADEVAAVLAARPEAVLLLPAGGTPVPLYGELRRRVAAGALDLSRAHLVQLDEMVGVDPRDPRSFHAFLRAHLLGRVPREPGRDHLLDGCTGAPGLEIARHAACLARLGEIDLALLGIGLNGHVAFNEPGSTLADGARVVELGEPTRSALAPAFAPAPAPRRGITLGLREIAGARRVVLLATGAKKAAVLAGLTALVDGEPGPSEPLETPAEGPGSAVGPALPAACLDAHAELHVLADAAACSALPVR